MVTSSLGGASMVTSSPHSESVMTVAAPPKSVENLRIRPSLSNHHSWLIESGTSAWPAASDGRFCSSFAVSIVAV